MQVPALKRTTMNVVVGLALALGLAATIAFGVATFNASSESASQPAVAHVESIGPVQGSFLEQRNAQIDAGPSEVEHVANLATMRRFFDAKMVRIEAMEAARGEQMNLSAPLTPSQQRYVDLKSDQMDGIAPGQ